MTDQPETLAGELVLSFADSAAFDAWLASQSVAARGIWLKLAKKGAGVGGLSKAEAIDAALCHGWIDGQQRPCDELFWLTRFTPRRASSRWSQVNRSRALELIEEGRMKPVGLAAIDSARADGRWDAAYAPASSAMPSAEFQAALDASPAAAAFFATLSGANRYAILHRIANLKTAAARTRRMMTYLTMLERGETVYT